jgi:hypothetical protein
MCLRLQLNCRIVWYMVYGCFLLDRWTVCVFGLDSDFFRDRYDKIERKRSERATTPKTLFAWGCFDLLIIICADAMMSIAVCCNIFFS